MSENEKPKFPVIFPAEDFNEFLSDFTCGTSWK